MIWRRLGNSREKVKSGWLRWEQRYICEIREHSSKGEKEGKKIDQGIFRVCRKSMSFSLLEMNKIAYSLMTNWNYNSVITVRVYKNEVWWPLRIWSQTELCNIETWTFSELSDTQECHQRYSEQHLPVANFWSQGLPLELCNYYGPNQSLLNKHSYFLSAPIIILNKQLM